MVYVALAAAILASMPSPALAEDGEAGGVGTAAPADTVAQYDYSDDLLKLRTQTELMLNAYQGGNADVIAHLQSIERLLQADPNSAVDSNTAGQETEQDKLLKSIDESLEKMASPEEESEELKTLKNIDEKLGTIAEPVEEEIEAQAMLSDAKDSRASYTFNAYSNVNPTGTYATYAQGMLPRVGFDEHYCYLQDTSSSYVFVWGDLREGSTGITGDADWVRWYYSGTQSGYLTESGSGTVTITRGGHVVMSDLGNAPMLDAQSDLLRKEVGYYAVVAVALWSLASVLGFCIRLNRGGA